MRGRVLTAVGVVAVAVSAAGCGHGQATTTGRPEKPERAQTLPKLPTGWKPHRNRAAGFAIGAPTQWQLSGHGDRALFRSPDHLVAVTVTADRAERTFRTPIGRFAQQALGALPGFKVPLKPSKPSRFHGTPLEAVETTATGAQAGGLRERATLIVLRRDRLVNYTVAVLENAEQPGAPLDRAVALRMIRTLRDIPPPRHGAGAG